MLKAMFILGGNRNFVSKDKLQQMMSTLNSKCGDNSLRNLLSNVHTKEQLETGKSGNELRLKEELRMGISEFEQWGEQEHEVLLRHRLHGHFPALSAITGPTFKKFLDITWQTLTKNGDKGLNLEELESIVGEDPAFKQAPLKATPIQRLASLLVYSSVCKRDKSRVLHLSSPQMDDFNLFTQNLERFIIAGARGHAQMRHPINPVLWQKVLYGDADADPATLLRIRRLCSSDVNQLNMQIREFQQQLKQEEDSAKEIVLAEETQGSDLPLWKRLLRMIGIST